MGWLKCSDIRISYLVIEEQMIDVLGPEKRRRRTTPEKIAIVQQSFEPGLTASLVARQHSVAASYFSGASNTRREALLR
ncbi:transposase [Escherichia coli]|nr:transposase [Escherichia coli]